MQTFYKICLILMIVGGINWGLVGLFQFDFVGWLLGGSASIWSRIVFTLVGIAASRGCIRRKRMNDPLSQSLRHCQLPRKGELYCACPPEVKKLSLRESWRVSA